jgi:uncharacterized protein YndB with AHSA1/START domain
MTEPGIDTTRVFAAPRERIWQEWTEPERFSDWFGGPDAEIPIGGVTMDVRVGGRWSLTMHFGPRRIHWHGEYREVVPPERLVFTITDRPEQEDPDEHVIVALADLGDGRTRQRALSLCDSFEGRDMMLASGMEVGVHDGYAKLDGLLADGSI